MTIKALALATISLIAACGSVDAGERPWYLGLEAGVELEGGGTAYGPADDLGWAGLITVGKGITSHISLEAELGYRAVSSDGYWGVSADVDQISLIVNAIYELPLSDDVTLALGVGLGTDNVQYDYDWGFSENEVEIAGQLKVGLSVELSESTELMANYRYVDTFTASAIDDNTVTVGIRFDL